MASTTLQSTIPPSSASPSLLPPRKRAKTDEEKEQRRIERILRNRRAAHASREKKRKHVEILENYVNILESNLKTYSTVLSQLFDNESTSDLLLQLNDKLPFDLFELRNIKNIERPDGLDINTSQSFKRKSSSSSPSSNNSKSGSSSKSNNDDVDVSSDEENEDEDNEYELRHKMPSPSPSLTYSTSEQSLITKKLDVSTSKKNNNEQEVYLLSPPNSTSPSKLSLESDIMKLEYSNLFDDEEEEEEEVKIKQEEIPDQINNTTNPSNVLQDLNDDLSLNIKLEFPSDPESMNVLNEYNSVHHPAAMMLSFC